MKVRIKFSKEGPVKFVGHLDTMRYFQKAIRRANLPVAFSGGFSPHMIMSFAAPLGVGTESLGEYFDLELAETVPTSEITRRLDAVMVEGVHVLVHAADGHAGLIFLHHQQGLDGPYRLDCFPEGFRLMGRYTGVDLGNL